MIAGPIGADEARGVLAPLRGAPRVLLAVSGGPDSIALMHLAAALAETGAWPPMVVGSVDHQLQPGAADLAAEVVARARALHLPAHVLTWTGDKPRTGLQAAARDARYALLIGLARETGASRLVTAHTLDDQAETILLRMTRGSGPGGLAGMRPAIERDGIVHLRPFLRIAKQRLVDTCRAAGWAYVEDAANRDPRHARTRIRHLMPRLAAEGLDARTLATLGERLARSEAAILDAARALRARAALPSTPDRIGFEARTLFGQPRAVVLAALGEALAGFGHPGPPRLGRLEALVEHLAQALEAGRPARRTLHGALVRLASDGRLELAREPPRRHGFMAVGGEDDEQLV